MAVLDNLNDEKIDRLNSNLCGFIDISKELVANHGVPVSTVEEYIATENCYIVANVCGYANDGGSVQVDGKIVLRCFLNGDNTRYSINTLTFPLKKGQVVKVYSPAGFGSSYAIYGMC